jgi:hypothetical protein
MVRRTRRQRGGLFGFGSGPKNPFTQPTNVVNPNPLRNVANPMQVTLKSVTNLLDKFVEREDPEISRTLMGNVLHLSPPDKNTFLDYVVTKINTACDWTTVLTPSKLIFLFRLSQILINNGATSTIPLKDCVTQKIVKEEIFKFASDLNDVLTTLENPGSVTVVNPAAKRGPLSRGGNRKQKRSKSRRSRA